MSSCRSAPDTACGEARTGRESGARRASGASRSRRRAASCEATAHHATARAASWTGRALIARATDSELPPFVTAGTHRTRVSEMRDVAPRRRGTSLVEAPAAPAASPSPTERSALGRGRPQLRWRG